MKKIILVATFLLLNSIAPGGWATATFDSSTYAKLAYQGFTGGGGAGSVDLSILDLSLTPGGHATPIGAATGTLNESVNTDGDGVSLAPGEMIELESAVQGTASNGQVTAASSSSAILEIINSFADPVTLEFSLTSGFNFFTNADPGDAANAYLEMLVVVYDLSSVVPDVFLVDRLLDSLLGDPNDSSGGLVTQSIFVDMPASGAFGVDIILTAEGSASATQSVPEPYLIVLLCTGLGVLGLSKRLNSVRRS
ncbi:MAG: PEP-CTERM sorting domain-containing protein [Gammaproteobacteria bacterium]|nr:PEP-CTERM sorting domain-containing protein [Gammaproteobacteria bacterium]